jgi:hypothetical protein
VQHHGCGVKRKYDVVILGAGHNDLVAAAYASQLFPVITATPFGLAQLSPDKCVPSN